MILEHVVQKSSVRIPFLLVSWYTSMLFVDSEHLENFIKCSWVEQALQNEHLFNRPLPPKMANRFMLHDKETEGIRFLL